MKYTYFKDTGKWYTEGEDDIDPGVEAIAPIVENLNRNKRLPGLASGTWDGYVLVVFGPYSLQRIVDLRN